MMKASTARSTQQGWVSKSTFEALAVESGEESEDELVESTPLISPPDRYASHIVGKTKAHRVYQFIRVASEALEVRYQESQGSSPTRATAAEEGSSCGFQTAEQCNA